MARLGPLVRSIALVPIALAVVLAQDAPKRRNAIIFVADGLRHGSVNPIDTPALYRVRTEGVYFANSHAVFPSQTMPNAAAIATGHYPGRYGAVLQPDFHRPSGVRDRSAGPAARHCVHRMSKIHSCSRTSTSDSAATTSAKRRCWRTRVRTVTTRRRSERPVLLPRRICRRPRRSGDGCANPIDDHSRGRDGHRSRGIPLTAETIALLKAAGLPPAPPPRDQPAGTNTTPGMRTANVAHQQWFADAATTAILPAFAKSAEPFMLVFWSGDPDHTQHAQGDSLNQLVPGINGATSKAAIQNADRNLKQILDYLDANHDVRDNTNLFVTSDHGFSTVSRRDVDAAGRATRSYSAGLRYTDADGRQEVNDGFLPIGFLAIDLAHELNLPLFDPEHADRGRSRRAALREGGSVAREAHGGHPPASRQAPRH